MSVLRIEMYTKQAPHNTEVLKFNPVNLQTIQTFNIKPLNITGIHLMTRWILSPA